MLAAQVRRFANRCGTKRTPPQRHQYSFKEQTSLRWCRKFTRGNTFPRYWNFVPLRWTAVKYIRYDDARSAFKTTTNFFMSSLTRFRLWHRPCNLFRNEHKMFRWQINYMENTQSEKSSPTFTNQQRVDPSHRIKSLFVPPTRIENLNRSFWLPEEKGAMGLSREGNHKGTRPFCRQGGGAGLNCGRTLEPHATLLDEANSRGFK